MEQEKELKIEDIRKKKLAWNRKGQIKLSSGNFYGPEKGTILSTNILNLISDSALLGLINDGSIKDTASILKDQYDADKKATDIAMKAAEARAVRLSVEEKKGAKK